MASHESLIVPGRPESSPADRADDLPDFRVVHEARIDARARGDREEHRFDEAEPDDLLEIEYEGGFVRWTSVARERAAQSRRRGREERGPLHLAPEPGTGERAFMDWVWKGLRILRLDPTQAAAEWSADRIAKHFRDKLEPGPGLYRIRSPRAMQGLEKLDGRIDAEPHLLLLHGTFSTTLGSFGDLDDPHLGASAPWSILRHAYGDRILALEHDTLVRSPIENALDVARSLAEHADRGARLHLLSHSRGGLVGELLCAGGLTPEEIELRYRRTEGHEAWDQRDRKALNELVALLEGVKVERFVRVACPARGTTLGDRLDLFASVTLNLLSRVPALGENPLFSFAKETALRLLRLREEEPLPGIEAQMPGSPLVRLLNGAAPVEGELAVVAGDLEGQGFARVMFEWVANAFYRESEHDLVVPTRAMDGGLPRRREALYAEASGPEVTHFGYFRAPETAGWVVSGLREGDAPQGFVRRPRARSTGEARRRAGLRGPSGAPATERPIALLLPGIMGSRLAVDGDEIWLDLLELAGGGIAQLEVSAAASAEGLLDRAYGDLVDHLAGTHHVRPFPYDWRLSMRQAADALSREMARLLGASSQPIRLLAHSMGGLVARTAQARHPEVWARVMERPGSRLIMLGTPNGGSFSIPRMLLGRDRLIRMLALLDFRHSLEEQLRLVAAFPGVLELLPRTSERGFDAFDAAQWQPLRDADDWGWTVPAAGALAAARELRDQIDAAPIDPERVLYVAGEDRSTPEDVEVRGSRVVFHGTARGDGRVPWDTGLLPGVRTWYMPVSHGDLANGSRHFAALDELLEHGTTARLPTEEPATRGVGLHHEVPDLDDVVYPSLEDLEDAALGGQGGAEDGHRLPELSVSVLHGDATELRGRPVLVGHHESDTIVSVEAALDRSLGARLSDRYQAGGYPGPLGTQAYFAQPDPRRDPAGVLVVGLGPVGELGAAELQRTVTRGVLDLALLPDGGGADALAGEGRLASVLVGAGEGSRLSIRDSLRAVTEGVLEANRRLRELGRSLVRDLQFVELYEDLAIAAARTLRDLETTLDRNGEVAVAHTLRSGRGGRRRTYPGQGREEWWRRVRISQPAEDRLAFRTLTDRAGTDAYTLKVQRTVLDHLSRLAVEDDAQRPEVGTLLLRQAVPRPLRARLLEGERMLLIVDQHTASLPWELLEEYDPQENALPFAVRSGMMRQFELTDADRDVRRASGNAALVIGDPALDGTPDYDPLPGAESEARAVARLLERQGFELTGPLIQASWPEVFRAIQRPHRVLHIAGHGEFDAEHPENSGVILSEGVRITAAEITALDPVPELVFLNCCYLGRFAGDRVRRASDLPALASGIARALIQRGVRAVIAAGWPVGDEDALEFATLLYGELLRGLPLGTALRVARERIHGRPGDTWGAYQCYGDPDFRLRSRADGEPSLRRPIVSRRELLERLEGLGEARMDPDRRVHAVATQLAEAQPEWLDGEVHATAAEALRRGKCFEAAIEQYELAVAHPRPGAPLRAAEQLANLRVRRVAGLAHDLQRGREVARRELGRARSSVRKGIAQLDALCRIAPTGERRSLLGSAYKRLASLSPAEKRAELLEDAAAAYEQALEVGLASGGVADVAYPALNMLRCRLLAGDEPPQGLDPKQKEVLAAARAEGARRTARDDPQPWDFLTQPDALLVERLADGSLAERRVRAELRREYELAREKGSLGDFSSVVEELDFAAWMMMRRRARGADPWKELRQSVQELRSELG